MVAVRFYRALAGEVDREIPDLDGLTLSTWRPRRDGPPSRPFFSTTNLAWYGMDRLRLFSRPDVTVYALHDGANLLHRLLVTPRWYRFPFMRADDLQLGMLWTEPSMRGKGLAANAIKIVHNDFAGSVRAFWYLVPEDNSPSIKLIERVGYTLAGRGVRTRPMGISMAGRYAITSPVLSA